MPATKIILTSGNNQNAKLGSLLTNPLVAIVQDAGSLPIAGTTVTFHIETVPQGATGASLTGTLQTVAVVTGVDGRAEVALTLGDTVGDYVVSATAAGLTNSPLSFTATAFALNGFILLSDVRDYLKIDAADTSKDSWLQGQINTVSDAFERFVCGPIALQNFTNEIYDGPGSDKLYVRNRPLVSLLTAGTDGNGFVNDISYRISPESSWLTFVKPEHVFIKSDKPYYVELWMWAFPGGTQNVRISYKAGYASIPGDIVDAAIDEVAQAFKEANISGEGRLGMKSKAVTSGGVTGTHSYYDIGDRTKEVLRRYRWPALGIDR